VKPARNIWDFHAQAKHRLPRAIWEFIERGSEDDILIHANRTSLERIKFTPRMLRDVSDRDQSVDLFGRTLPCPLIIAPTGIADLVNYRGERALAAAAAKAGIPFTITTSSTTAVETIAGIATKGLWQQIYLWDRRDLSWQVVDRAAKAGAEVLVVTADMPCWPNREFNKRNGMANPIKPNLTLALNFLTKPRWFLSIIARYCVTGGIPKFANYPAELTEGDTGGTARMTNSASVNWDDIRELRRRWSGKLLVKGLLSVEDAKIAVNCGVDGIIVSNHGGRIFDCSPPAIDVLAEIVDAVGAQIPILFDSGIRRGSDVLKALALGAKAVLIGRATLYGLAAGGEAGAARALAILRDEIDMSMAMIGVTKLDQLDRSFLRGHEE
jgi:(S)-mandelate dehydrogenase